MSRRAIHRRPAPAQVCEGGDSFRDFDGSAEWAPCNAAATCRARVVEDPRAFGQAAPRRRARIRMCAHHAAAWNHDSLVDGGVFGLVSATPAYRYRTVTA